MPQLDISTYLPQIFWVILTFITLWMILDKMIIPRIADTINARKRKYDSSVMKSEEINKKAMMTLQRYQETLAAAKKEASKRIEKNENELKAFIKSKEEEIETRIHDKIAESELTLATEKNETMNKIEELSEKTAFAVATQLGLDMISLNDIHEVSHKKD